MEYRNLGRTGLKVSEVCLGAMHFGGPTDEQTSVRILDEFAEAGGTFVDTADVYNAGESEVERKDSEAECRSPAVRLVGQPGFSRKVKTCRGHFAREPGCQVAVIVYLCRATNARINRSLGVH